MGSDRHTPIELEQDCEATLIPGGQKVTLRRGERVVVTQALGGSFTVQTDQGHLARIDAQQYRDAVEQGKITDSLLISTYGNYRLLVAASGRNLLLYRANVELSRQKFVEGLISIDSFQKTFEDYLRAENTHLNNLSLLFSAMASIISRN